MPRLWPFRLHLSGRRKAMTRAAIQRLILVLLPALSIFSAAQAEEVKPPEFVAVGVGFAGRYKAGLWTPIVVTLRGGEQPVSGRVRARLSDSDGLNCSYEAAEPCQVLPGGETKVLLYVRFGHEASTLSLELLDDEGKSLAAKMIDSSQSATNDSLAD